MNPLYDLEHFHGTLDHKESNKNNIPSHFSDHKNYRKYVNNMPLPLLRLPTKSKNNIVSIGVIIITCIIIGLLLFHANSYI